MNGFLLGGKEDYAVDREASEGLLKLVPSLKGPPQLARRHLGAARGDGAAPPRPPRGPAQPVLGLDPERRVEGVRLALISVPM